MSGLDQYTKLMLHCDGVNGSTSFPDQMAQNIVTANGVAVVTTAQAKFGTASCGINDPSGNSYLSVPYQQWFEPLGDFTIDGWSYLTSVASVSVLVFKGGIAANFAPYFIRVAGAGNWELSLSSNGTGFDIANAVAFGVASTNVWQHIALCRQGTNYFAFVNGVSGLGVLSSASPLFANGSPLLVGARPAVPQGFAGNIDEFRFSNGIARWTANFTPPTQPYTFDPSSGGLIGGNASFVTVKPPPLIVG